MNIQPSEAHPLDVAIERVSEDLNADIIHYNGPIERSADRLLIEMCISRRKRKNALFILVTTGGDPDAAYRMARCLQSKYDKFILYVSGYCKSAGTLVAIGAHELVISDHGELGPLDVQMYKKDDLIGMQSGLTVMDTMTALRDNAFNAFEKYFIEVMAKSTGTITLRSAAEIATNLTNGLFTPLSGQVDPLHIGEAGRAMSIAGHYGKRLLRHGQNIEMEELEFIISEYPSHGFVIDRGEAELLFKNVREPSEKEIFLAEMLGQDARWPEIMSRGDEPPFRFLSSEPDEPSEPDGEDDDGTTPGRIEGAGPGKPSKAPRGKPKGGDRNREAVPTSGAPIKAGDSA